MLTSAFFVLCLVADVVSQQLETKQRGAHRVDGVISERSHGSVGKLLRRDLRPEANAMVLNPSGAVAPLHMGYPRVKVGNCSDDMLHGDCDEQRSQTSRSAPETYGAPRLSVIAPHSLAVDLHKDSKNEKVFAGTSTSWQVISIGDAQALTIHDGVIYIVAHEEELHMLERGIYAQTLDRMTPYSNWTLLGLGSLSSIAIHDAADGKTMYGVGQHNWLYRQTLSALVNGSVWEVANVFTLKAIAIYGDTIYGVSKEQPSHVFKLSCTVFGQPNAEIHGWYPFTTGNIKTFSVVGNSIFAVFENNMIYNKSVTQENDHSSASDEVAIEDMWTLTNNANMLSVAVLGDTIYGVSPEYKVCRAPIVVHSSWAPIAAGSILSLAVNAAGDTIYGAGGDGKLYKQDLLVMNPGTEWMEVSPIPYVTSIAIQGNIIYGVGPDKRVYKQQLDSIAPNTSWEVASSCCVLQIAAADGILYAINDDSNVYGQIDILMTAHSKWVLLVQGPVKSIAIRGDTMYSIAPDGTMLAQRLSSMATSTPWQYGKDLGDHSYPSKEYISIMAHNDIMYACGSDKAVYSKLIHHAIEYPPGLSAHGDTHHQALYWNVTFARIPKQLHAHAHNLTTTMARQTTIATAVPTTSIGPTFATTSEDVLLNSEPGVGLKYVDGFRDFHSNATYSSALRSARVRIPVTAVLLCLILTSGH